ncbi:ankyrin, partial [Coprinopsis marcescibilis]
VHKVKIWLTDINFNVIQMDNLSQRAPNTGIWVIKNRKFQAWLKEGGILWGTGMPGAGKTILSSIVIDHLRELAKTQGNICVAFAFCRYTDRISVKDILAALLKQLLECYPDLVWPFVEPLVRAHYNKGTHPSQIELFEVLRRIATSGLFATGYCVLDGLDEAKNDVQIDLLSVFSSLPINFFITSRPLTSLRDLAPNAVFMDIVVHDSDIALLVEQRISRMHGRLIFKHNDDLKREVISKIQSKASGMFLLASLHLDMLEECLSVKDFRDSLDHLPDGVNAMYAATMGRIEKQRILPVVQRLLAWVIYSRRPLRTEDLERALAVCPTTYQFDPQRRVETESIVSLCCGLLTIDPKSRLVRLIHYTAREYLKVYLKVNLPENPHTLIASTCAMLLLQYGFANFDVENEGRQMAADFRSKPLLEYAYSSWFAHAQQSSSKATILVDFVRRCRRYPLQQAFWPRKWDKLKSIHIPAAFKLVDILRQIVERNPSGETPGISSARLCDVNATTALGATALTLAASLGHLEIVNVLLGVEGVDVNVAAFHDMTAIAEASSNGDISIVERLLQVDGIDFNARDQNGRTPLLIASSKGHDDVVKALVNTDGIAVNLPDSDGNTALIEASRNGHVEVVRTLLGVEGIDVNAVDEDG